jgi:vancomycin resistance protein YoaR
MLLISLWFLNPFACPLVSRSVSITELNSAQRVNITRACRALDGMVLRPGEEFSFNARVGPRTERRGYLAARTYIGQESPLTTGGGICCLSSLLYQVALEGGLTIVERKPHLRTVHTVPPGLDATVWYGGADLRFRNDSASPLVLSAKTSRATLSLALMASRFTPPPRITLRTSITRRGSDSITVEVFRASAGQETLVSRDLYRRN